MVIWQRRLARFKSTLATKMSVPEHEKELIEVVRRNLRSMPLEPGLPQRNVLVKLKPHLEEALGVLDDLDRSGGLSTEEREQQEAFRVLRGAIEELE